MRYRRQSSLPAALALLIVASACGDQSTTNVNRMGSVQLSQQEAWEKVRQNIPNADRYQACAHADVACADFSRYVRVRSDRYWFVLHDLAQPCADQPSTCTPDRYRYLEVTVAGLFTDKGYASVLQRVDGQYIVVEGEIRWNIPDLDRDALDGNRGEAP